MTLLISRTEGDYSSGITEITFDSHLTERTYIYYKVYYTADDDFEYVTIQKDSNTEYVHSYNDEDEIRFDPNDFGRYVVRAYRRTGPSSLGNLGTAIVTIPEPPLSLPTISDQVWTQNSAVSFSLPQATGSVTGYTLTPSLPAGLSRSGRSIRGTPSAAYSATRFTWTAVRGRTTVSQTFTITVRAAALEPLTLPTIANQVWTFGERIDPLVLPTGTGEPPLSYSFSGQLPAGITRSFRTIIGTPTSVQDATTYTWRLSDSTTRTAITRSFTIRVIYEPLVFEEVSLPLSFTVTTGQATTLDMPAITSGSGTITYSAEDLPTGLSVSGTDITGTVPAGTAAETLSLVWKATSSTGQELEQPFTLIIQAGVNIPPISNVTILKDRPASITLPAAIGAPSGSTYALSNTPVGLTFSPSTRVISGTPTTAANYDVSYTVSHAGSVLDTETFRITVGQNENVTLGGVTHKRLTNGIAARTTLPQTTSGDAPITYALAGGTLPDGLSFSASTRQIAGTPSSGATSVMHALQATDNNNDKRTSSFLLTVHDPDTAPETTLDDSYWGILRDESNIEIDTIHDGIDRLRHLLVKANSDTGITTTASYIGYGRASVESGATVRALIVPEEGSLEIGFGTTTQLFTARLVEGRLQLWLLTTRRTNRAITTADGRSPYWLKVNWNGTAVRAKAWRPEADEPTSWQTTLNRNLPSHARPVVAFRSVSDAKSARIMHWSSNPAGDVAEAEIINPHNLPYETVSLAIQIGDDWVSETPRFTKSDDNPASTSVAGTLVDLSVPLDSFLETVDEITAPEVTGSITLDNRDGHHDNLKDIADKPVRIYVGRAGEDYLANFHLLATGRVESEAETDFNATAIPVTLMPVVDPWPLNSYLGIRCGVVGGSTTVAGDQDRYNLDSFTISAIIMSPDPETAGTFIGNGDYWSIKSEAGENEVNVVARAPDVELRTTMPPHEWHRVVFAVSGSYSYLMMDGEVVDDT